MCFEKLESTASYRSESTLEKTKVSDNYLFEQGHCEHCGQQSSKNADSCSTSGVDSADSIDSASRVAQISK